MAQCLGKTIVVFGREGGRATIATCPGHCSLASFVTENAPKFTFQEQKSSSWHSRPPHWFQPEIPPWLRLSKHVSLRFIVAIFS